MNIEQLKNGKYRIRQDYKGKTYRETLDHKPSKKEAMLIMNKIISADNIDCYNMTFDIACQKYLEIKSNVLSPSTKRGYASMIKQFSDRFNRIKLNEITQADVQKEINDYSLNHASKSAANLHGFMSAVIKEFRPSMQLYTKLPQKQMNRSGYIPTEEEVKRIIDYLPLWHSIGIKLAICGLRRSEICGLQKCDLDDNNILHIKNAFVQDENRKWHLKAFNKTDSSTRDVMIPADLAQEIRDLNVKTRIYPYNPQTLYRALVEAQKALNIPHFKLHSLRAFYASYLHSLNVPDAYIQASGGWRSDYIMKSVYRRTLDDVQKEIMEKSANKINEIYN